MTEVNTTEHHTPGPWMIGDESKKENPLMVYCDDSLGSRVADCSTSGHGLTLAQDRANARLIAAAPDLLKAARELFAALGAPSNHMHIEDARFAVLAAIKKAEGR